MVLIYCFIAFLATCLYGCSAQELEEALGENSPLLNKPLPKIKIVPLPEESIRAQTQSPDEDPTESEETCKRPERQELGECIKPLVRSWEDIIRVRNSPVHHSFELFKYNRRELQRLCNDYRWMHTFCYTSRILENCRKHPFFVYIESNLAVACGNHTNGSFLESFDCIHKVTLDEGGKCLNLIRKSYLPGQENGKCQNMGKYFKCMSPILQQECEQGAVTVLRAALRGFGCGAKRQRPTTTAAPSDDNDIGGGNPLELTPSFFGNVKDGEELTGEAAQELPNENRAAVKKILTPLDRIQNSARREPKISFRPAHCDQETEARVRNCFYRLVDSLINAGQERGANFSNVTFPLFTYAKSELLELCDKYASAFVTCKEPEIRACQDDPVVNFAVENMGYACGRQISEFFSSFDCISDALSARPHCLQFVEGLPHPISTRTKCTQMPQFYDCVKEGMGECPQKSLTIFQESILRFGCKFIADS